MHSERSTGAPGMRAYGAPRRRRRTAFWGQGQGLRDPERGETGRWRAMRRAGLLSRVCCTDSPPCLLRRRAVRGPPLPGVEGQTALCTRGGAFWGPSLVSRLCQP